MIRNSNRASTGFTRTGKRRNLGTFRSRAVAERHERQVPYFERLG